MDEALQRGAVVVVQEPLGCSGSLGVTAGCGWWSQCPWVAELEVTSSPPTCSPNQDMVRLTLTPNLGTPNHRGQRAASGERSGGACSPPVTLE